MYAVILTGGKQYKVSEGDVIDIEKLDAEIGDTVDFDVLFICDGSRIVTDADALANVKVEAEVLDQFKGEKVIIRKFKRRKRYKRTKGHRQLLTKVKITSIIEGAADKAEEPAAEEPAEQAEKPAAEAEAAE